MPHIIFSFTWFGYQNTGRVYLKGVFQRIAEEYELVIDTMEVMGDNIHIFVEVPGTSGFRSSEA